MKFIQLDPIINLMEKFFDYYSGKTFFAKTSVYFYVNPTSTEITKNIASGSRGWISPSGDIYLEGYEEPMAYSSIIHHDVLNILSMKLPKKFPKPVSVDRDFYFEDKPWFSTQCKRYGILIQRNGTSNRIYISESIHDYDYPFDTQALELIKAKALIKNPYWKFRF
jgi:hypothetical protein